MGMFLLKKCRRRSREIILTKKTVGHSSNSSSRDYYLLYTDEASPKRAPNSIESTEAEHCEMPPKTKTSDTRRTRSQVAPDWTHTQTLILVNEIAAVEADCLDALSYYQKWKIIAENCAALDVNRTLDQCRRKWGSLFSDYNAIKSWQPNNNARDSYWGFGRERRREIGLPEEFEHELFEAVDDVVKAQVERVAFGPDTVMEDADAHPLVLTRQSHQFRPQKRQIESEMKPNKKTVGDKETGSVDVMASLLEENPGSLEIMAPKLRKNARSMEVVATNPRKKAVSAEVLAAQLRESAEMIQAILEVKLGENKDYSPSGLRKDPGSSINLARRQGDKLIDCFSVIANSLDQLCKVAPHEMR